MRGARRRRSIHGSQINKTRVRVCLGCRGFVPDADSQCPSCGRLDWHSFDSFTEAKRYGELCLLEQAGEVSDIQIQPRFNLDAIAPNGAVIRIGFYKADFSYRDIRKGRDVIEDVKGKGIDTSLSAWKRKHAAAQYGVTISIVER